MVQSSWEDLRTDNTHVMDLIVMEKYTLHAKRWPYKQGSIFYARSVFMHFSLITGNAIGNVMVDRYGISPPSLRRPWKKKNIKR